MKVLKIEVKKDKNNNDMKIVSFEGESKSVYVNSKYDSAIYDKVIEGAEFELVADGNFLKVKYDKPVSGNKTGAITAAQNKKAEMIHEAQTNKEHGIKIASCNGQAGNIVAALIHSGQLKGREDIEKALKYWKSYLYTRWDDISNEATPFD